METARTFYANLPPPAECLAILVGCAELTVFGLGGLANPVEWSKAYGLPVRTAKSTDTEEARKTEQNQLALVSAIAARNTANGVLTLALACYARDRRALGIAVLCNVVTTLADTVLVRWYGAQDMVFGHVVGIVNSIGIGGALLYWGRGDPWPWN